MIVHIICAAYKPNTAPTNRILAFVRAFDKYKDIKFKLVFLYPDANKNRLSDSFSNTEIIYLWDRRKFTNKIIKFIYSFIDVFSYTKKLGRDDVVFLYGSGQYLPIIIKNKQIKIYHERTEHPQINPVSPKFLQKKYLKACRHLSGLFVISTTLKKYFEDMGATNVHIVNMIVDPSRFEGISKQKTGRPYIAYCGTASNNKDGVDKLIKAFSIVHTSQPEYQLLIMGAAPSKNDESGNLKLVKDLGLENDVVFTGVVPVSEMPQKLINADIVALNRPDSLQAQCGFPTKLGEYLLSKNPVVVTTVGDIPLFLKDRDTAILSAPDNCDEFASKLLWLIENRNEAKLIGERGSHIAVEHFNSEHEVEKIIKVIRS